MPTEQNKLYLYEALELRAEYDARIKTLRDCLPESAPEPGPPRHVSQRRAAGPQRGRLQCRRGA